jgi:hypothetical protein
MSSLSFRIIGYAETKVRVGLILRSHRVREASMFDSPGSASLICSMVMLHLARSVRFVAPQSLQNRTLPGMQFVPGLRRYGFLA